MGLISVVSDISVGGTFLSWSLHYLAGHDTVYSYENQQWLKITDAPLNKSNAHQFASNLISGPDRFYDMLEVINNTKSDQFHHIYFHPFKRKYSDQNVAAIQKLCSASNKVLLLEHQGENQELYWCKYKARTFTPKNNNWAEVHTNWDEQHAEYVGSSVSTEKLKNSTTEFGNNTWDYREFLAVHWDKLVPPRITEYFDYAHPHYLINTYDMFNSLDQHIQSIFYYLNLEISTSRLKDWQLVYQEWRKIHHDRMQFQTYFNTIIENIKHNKYMDLTRFNLDIVREAAIQHHFIKHHNLNFKTWQLTEFKNTQQLHALLEPSQHSI